MPLENGSLGIHRHEPTLDGLRAFEKEVTASGTLRYGAPGGLHDDLATALMLANWGLTAPHATDAPLMVIPSRWQMYGMDQGERAKWIYDNHLGYVLTGREWERD